MAKTVTKIRPNKFDGDDWMLERWQRKVSVKCDEVLMIKASCDGINGGMNGVNEVNEWPGGTCRDRRTWPLVGSVHHRVFFRKWRGDRRHSRHGNSDRSDQLSGRREPPSSGGDRTSRDSGTSCCAGKSSGNEAMICGNWRRNYEAWRHKIPIRIDGSLCWQVSPVGCTVSRSGSVTGRRSKRWSDPCRAADWPPASRISNWWRTSVRSSTGRSRILQMCLIRSPRWSATFQLIPDKLTFRPWHRISRLVTLLLLSQLLIRRFVSTYSERSRRAGEVVYAADVERTEGDLDPMFDSIGQMEETGTVPAILEAILRSQCYVTSCHVNENISCSLLAKQSDTDQRLTQLRLRPKLIQCKT